ncbi:MAG: DNA polymerase Y family protein [Chromatiaceae bacterium]|nr:MAG: DNA polymerase Y family protein [Chromatiaceae bacterium]
MDWLAIQLPALSLQVYARGLAAPLPLAVSEHGRLLAASTLARQHGVRPGQTTDAALGLLSALRILPRRAAQERAALARLAAWALRFSAQVSLDPHPRHPAGLVLEAGRSQRLFGGAAALHRQVAAGAAALGWQARIVLAPTPGGALLLAAAGHDGLIADRAALHQALAALPTAALDLERQVRGDLAAMGIRRIGELLRLLCAGTSAELAIRIGLGPVQQLERLLGERADPRPPFIPPARFAATLELPAEVADAPALLFAGRRLIDELGGFLQARQAGVQRLDWWLAHAGLVPTRFRLGTARPRRDPAHWLLLLRERLEWLALPAPVRALRLVSTDLQRLPPRPDVLDLRSPAVPPETGSEAAIGTAGETGRGAVGTPAATAGLGLTADQDLFDRLRARLGDAAVRGLQPVAEHRPERAWRWMSPGGDPLRPGAAGARAVALPAGSPADIVASGLARAERPLWLLMAPLPLPQRDRRPWLDGPLVLAGGCERIETGWWDGQEVARDYYIATDARGERLWIYREMRPPRRWFLHGLFGSRVAPDTAHRH